MLQCWKEWIGKNRTSSKTVKFMSLNDPQNQNCIWHFPQEFENVLKISTKLSISSEVFLKRSKNRKTVAWTIIKVMLWNGTFILAQKSCWRNFWHLTFTRFVRSQEVNHLGKSEQSFLGCHHAKADEIYFKKTQRFLIWLLVHTN